MTPRARAGGLGALPLLGALLGLYLLVPIVAFVIRLLTSSDRGFDQPGLWPALGVSVLSASISTLVIAVLGIPLAWWLARSRRPLSRFVGVLVQLPLALPPVMGGIVLIYLVGPYTRLGALFGGRLTESLIGVVLAQTFVAAPFLVIAARSAFAAVDPTLDDLAATLGRGRWARFLLVDLRSAAPGIRAGALLTWLRAIGEYGATVLLAYHPYTLPVYTSVQFAGSGVPTTQAPTALALGVAVVVLAAAQFAGRRFAPRRPRRLPAPRHPAAGAATPVSFDVDVELGSFHLSAAGRPRSHRLAVLGPSGAGKSVLVRALLGLHGPSAGPVTYGDTRVDGIRTERRSVGYVPQGSTMFPGRRVADQVTFAAGADAGVAAWWLRTLRLDGYADRFGEQLSGGMRQRVALARALAAEPRLVFLDEPFSALDGPIRDELRQQVRRLQLDQGLSTVLVTHDPAEAAALADDVIVLDDGLVLQAGPVPEVYARPTSARVAALLGAENVLPGVLEAVDDAIGRIRTGGLVVHAKMPDAAVAAGADVLWAIEPADLELVALPAHDGGDDAAGLVAQVLDVVDLGTHRTVTLAPASPTAEGPVTLRARQSTGGPAPTLGSRLAVVLRPDRVRVWAADAGTGGL